MSVAYREGSEPVDIGEYVAAEIRAWMGRRGMRGIDLAEKCGKDDVWVSRRIRNKSRITLGDLALIAWALEVQPADLLPRLDSNQQPFD